MQIIFSFLTFAIDGEVPDYDFVEFLFLAWHLRGLNFEHKIRKQPDTDQIIEVLQIRDQFAARFKLVYCRI